MEIFDPVSAGIVNQLTEELDEFRSAKKPFRLGSSKTFLKTYERLIAHYRKRHAIPKLLKGPVFVGIDLTFRCNLSCPYCYLQSPLNTPELSTQQWMNVIDELASLETLIICFSGGEPTLRKDIFELVEYASKKFHAVNMVTNGLLVNEKFADRIVESGISAIQVSLDGSNPHVMDKLRGQGTFKKAISAIQVLVAHDIPVMISFACTKYNISDFPNVVELALKLGVLSVRTMYYMPVIPELAPSDDDYYKLIEWIDKNRDKYPIRIEFGDPLEHIKIGPFLPTLSFCITPCGFILPTPYIPLAYGHVEEGLKDLYHNYLSNIWNHPVFKTISTIVRTEYDIVRINDFCGFVYENPLNIKDKDEAEIKNLVDKIKAIV